MNRTFLEKTISDYLVTQPVVKAYLFGSVARGEDNEQSDIDVLVEWDYDQRITMLEHSAIQHDLAMLTGRKVDIVSAKGLSPHIAPYIEAQKQLFYERAK